MLIYARPSGATAITHAVEHRRRTVDRRACSNTSRTFMTSAPTFAGDLLGVHPRLGVVRERDPVGAFLYQQLNTFHSAAHGCGRVARLTGGRVNTPLDALGIPILFITGTDYGLFPAPFIIDSETAVERWRGRDRRRRSLAVFRAAGRVQRRRCSHFSRRANLEIPAASTTPCR